MHPRFLTEVEMMTQAKEVQGISWTNAGLTNLSNQHQILGAPFINMD